MSPFRESIKHIAQNLQTCEEWLEMVRDLSEPISFEKPALEFHMRWAEKKDLFEINALEGFVKETNFMEGSLRKGDRCLLLERENRIGAFAWVTFRDFALAPWYTLKLSRGWSYLVYIFVHPAYRGQGVGCYLLGSLMQTLGQDGNKKLVSGMYSNWESSIRLHKKMGFRPRRRLNQCKILDIIPLPPKEETPVQ
ncbi:MAG: GNAT family N-acetyltransferase [Deltaproteobacteria bacterium]